MSKKIIILKADGKLKHNAQIKALKEKRTLTDVIIDLLRKWLKK